MLKLADLARRADFDIGPLRVSPARRLVEGPAGSTTVEPIVMKVFLLLLDGAGSVVTRDELFGNAWGGIYVGDDSLNRAVARVRKIASDTAPGLFEIETIPRTGYRVSGEILAHLDTNEPEGAAGPVSRRGLISGGAAALALAGAGAWFGQRSRSSAQFDAIIAEAHERLLKGDPDARTANALQHAVSLRPESAQAWGMLALVNAVIALAPPPGGSTSALGTAQAAADKALALDPREPNALLAKFELEGGMLSWIERDRKLRQIIGIDPRSAGAIAELVLLTQATGLTRESWSWNERALQLDPLSVDALGRRALKLWILGRTSDADRVIDQVRALYPAEHWGWWVRFLIYAMTGRAPAAEAMLNSEPMKIGPAGMGEFWRACLPALGRPSPATVSAAREACLKAAKASGALAGQGVMIMSALNEVGTALEIANGFLLSRGPVVRTGEPPKGDMPDASWRINTQWLFTPPCASMRADSRFLQLCDGIGLTGYWLARGVRPDYQSART
jgi:DNA-binding winged helix-turn-helix (wHTH) protein